MEWPVARARRAHAEDGGEGCARAPYARGTRAKPGMPGAGEGGHLGGKKVGPPRALNGGSGGGRRRGRRGSSQPAEDAKEDRTTPGRGRAPRADLPAGSLRRGMAYGPRWVCSGRPRRPPQTPKGGVGRRGEAGGGGRECGAFVAGFLRGDGWPGCAGRAHHQKCTNGLTLTKKLGRHCRLGGPARASGLKPSRTCGEGKEGGDVRSRGGSTRTSTHTQHTVRGGARGDMRAMQGG